MATASKKKSIAVAGIVLLFTPSLATAVEIEADPFAALNNLVAPTGDLVDIFSFLPSLAPTPVNVTPPAEAPHAGHNVVPPAPTVEQAPKPPVQTKPTVEVTTGTQQENLIRDLSEQPIGSVEQTLPELESIPFETVSTGEREIVEKPVFGNDSITQLQTNQILGTAVPGHNFHTVGEAIHQSTPGTEVPEPMTAFLVATGLLGGAHFRKKRQG